MSYYAQAISESRFRLCTVTLTDRYGRRAPFGRASFRVAVNPLSP